MKTGSPPRRCSGLGLFRLRPQGAARATRLVATNVRGSATNLIERRRWNRPRKSVAVKAGGAAQSREGAGH